MITDHLHIDLQSDIPRYRQIENSIIEGIEDGAIQKGERLPSINAICTQYGLSRDTVVKAYTALKQRGAIDSAHGKGYFIAADKVVASKKIFVLFNELNEYKKVLHSSILKNLGADADIDIFFHNHNIEVFKDLINKSLGRYSHYVIMPTFNDHLDVVTFILKSIPKKRLYLIDRFIEGIPDGIIYQDFEKDTYECLVKVKEDISNYKGIHLIYDKEFLHPSDTEKSVRSFCTESAIDYSVSSIINDIQKGWLYFIVRDADLISLVKKGNEQLFIPGREYGIISYNDTPLKEIIYDGVTVISTDFDKMGELLVEQIESSNRDIIRNPVRLIRRGSL